MYLISAGMEIIYNYPIGNCVRIGANAVVMTDILDDCVVAREKIRIMQKFEVNNSIRYLFNN